jgi:hypothetical protein
MHNKFIIAEVDLASFADTYINPMLSTEVLSIITDGAEYTRTRKTELIADYKPAHEMLNVCVNHWGNRDSVTNCGFCSKCLRTLICLEALGKLDDFSKVFDINAYRKISYKYKCELVDKYDSDIFMKDNVDFAKMQGLNMPSKLEAHAFVIFKNVVHKAKTLISRIMRTSWGKNTEYWISCI